MLVFFSCWSFVLGNTNLSLNANLKPRKSVVKLCVCVCFCVVVEIQLLKRVILSFSLNIFTTFCDDYFLANLCVLIIWGELTRWELEGEEIVKCDDLFEQQYYNLESPTGRWLQLEFCILNSFLSSNSLRLWTIVLFVGSIFFWNFFSLTLKVILH